MMNTKMLLTICLFAGIALKAQLISAAATNPCARPCPEYIYDNPFCGSDGVTYSNPCVAAEAACENGYNITKLYDGSCLPEIASSFTTTQMPAYNPPPTRISPGLGSPTTRCSADGHLCPE